MNFLYLLALAMSMNDQVSTFTFFRFNGLRNKYWGLSRMGMAHAELRNVHGQEFYKLMGSGKGLGFNPFPDWSIYCLFQVWENEQAADAFFAVAPIMNQYRSRTEQVWTIYSRAISARGEWSGSMPLRNSEYLDATNTKVLVLTRATVKTSKLISFWRYVPLAQKGLHGNKDLIYTKGVGQYPFTQMATFSVWNNTGSMVRFAHKGKDGHAEGVRRVRKGNWFKEEMYARFQPYRFEGSWDDANFNETTTGDQ